MTVNTTDNATDRWVDTPLSLAYLNNESCQPVFVNSS